MVSSVETNGSDYLAREMMQIKETGGSDLGTNMSAASTTPFVIADLMFSTATPTFKANRLFGLTPFLKHHIN